MSEPDSEALKFVAAAFRMWEQSKGQSSEPPSAGLPNLQQAQSRLSPARVRPQPYSQPSRRSVPESAFPQILAEIKRQQDEMFATLHGVQQLVEQIKADNQESMAEVHDVIQKFESWGKKILLALQQSNSQLPSGSSSAPPNPPPPSQNISQQQTSSNLSRPYGQGRNVTQTPTFVSSSNPLFYAPPQVQAADSYSDPSYMDLGLEFLTNDTS